MNIGAVVLVLAIILLLGFLAGMFVLLTYVLQMGKKYAAYKAELQRTGKYPEWMAQHKGLVTFERVSFYANFVFLIAILVFGLSEKIANSPSILPNSGALLDVLVPISGTLVYLCFPYVLLSLFIYSRLYRKVPKDWQQH